MGPLNSLLLFNYKKYLSTPFDFFIIKQKQKLQLNSHGLPLCTALWALQHGFIGDIDVLVSTQQLLHLTSFCLRALISLCPLVIPTSKPDLPTEEWQLLTSSVEINLTLISAGRRFVFSFSFIQSSASPELLSAGSPAGTQLVQERASFQNTTLGLPDKLSPTLISNQYH